MRIADLAISMAGGGASCPEGQPLKTADQSLGWCYPPATGPAARLKAVASQNLEHPMTTKSKAKTRPASPVRKSKRGTVNVRNLHIADRIDTLRAFAEGIGDAVHGLEHVQSTECSGVHALIDALVENLRALSADVTGDDEPAGKTVRS